MKQSLTLLAINVLAAICHYNPEVVASVTTLDCREDLGTLSDPSSTLSAPVENSTADSTHTSASTNENDCVASNSDHDEIGRQEEEIPVYTAFDDASWGVSSTEMTTRLGHPHQKSFYDQFIRECIELKPECEDENEQRVYMNVHQPPSVNNYTKTGFKKIRAPEPLFRLIKEFWDINRDRVDIEYDNAGAYHNTWKYPTNLVMVEDDKYEGGGWNLSAAIWNSARDILEDWTGQKLSGSSVYGIRVYQNNSILAPHVDRFPLISSAIINVDQDVDQDWFLEVFGHDGKATNVTMKPGDMVLYESHSVIHGRPYPLKGKFYANIFVHFEPMGDAESIDSIPEEGALPPYLREGSDWEEHYWEEFPDGWELLSDVVSLSHRGDLYTLKYVAQREQSAITDTEIQCEILESAALAHQLDVLEWLFQDMQYNVNMICRKSNTVLDMAVKKFDVNDEIFNFLERFGAKTKLELTGDDAPILTKQDYVDMERCKAMTKAIKLANLRVMEFLLEEMDYDINVVCTDQGQLEKEWTFLEVAYESDEESSGNHQEVIEYLEKNGAVTLDDLDEYDSDEEEDEDDESISSS